MLILIGFLLGGFTQRLVDVGRVSKLACLGFFSPTQLSWAKAELFGYLISTPPSRRAERAKMADVSRNPPLGALHQSPCNVEQLMSEGHWRRLPKSSETPSRVAPAALFFSEVGPQTESGGSRRTQSVKMGRCYEGRAAHTRLTGSMKFVCHAACHCDAHSRKWSIAARRSGVRSWC